MFVRCRKRFKDGKEHRYWSVVENCRRRDGRVVQRQVLHLGEINDGQRAAWCRAVEVVREGSGAKPMALFAEDREAPELACETVRVKVGELAVRPPRQWGACWLALELWDRLELDRFWGPRLPASRQGTRWLDVLKTLAIYQLVDPGSEWRLHRHWYGHSAVADLLGAPEALSDDALYRCLDKLLASYSRQLPRPRGTGAGAAPRNSFSQTFRRFSAMLGRTHGREPGMGREARFRKDLSMPGMLAEMRRCFERVADPVACRGLELSDCLMSGLAVFSLKYPSLLQFEQDARGIGEARDGLRRENLRSLFGIGRAPSDSRMRERLDELDPAELRRPFKRLFALAQRGGVLKEFEWLGGRHLLSVDGTGHFSSPTVHCGHCCVKNHKDGTKTHYHQSLCAVLVHPERREVLPVVPPEPIRKADGERKNDCERNASKRLLRELRREHPHLPLVVVEDGLASNGPHVRLLKELDMRFVLGAKPGDHAALFAWVDELEATPPAPGSKPGVERWETTDAEGVEHRFRWSNGAPLNDANMDLEVNFLEYWERRPNGREKRFSWVTDLRVDRWNAMGLMRAGRARWRIENETFNTLKNQGCEFEHNFGHGEKHLATVFAALMLPAFAIDQLQKACCSLFQAALARKGRAKYFWEDFRSMFATCRLPDWETYYRALAFGHRAPVPVPLDTS